MKKKFSVLTFASIISIFLLDICSNKVYAICDGDYCNYEKGSVVSCSGIDKIPAMLPKIISIVYLLIQIAVPIVLVILGTIDLAKAVVAQKEDEMKKAQQIFFKRLIAAVLVFFVFTIVKFVISAVSKNSNIMDCAKCFIRNDCEIVQQSQKEDNDNGFTYMNCELDGYTFQLRSDGHIPAASVDCPGTGECAWDAKSDLTDASKCPSSIEYKASVTNDGVFVITKK